MIRQERFWVECPPTPSSATRMIAIAMSGEAAKRRPSSPIRVSPAQNTAIHAGPNLSPALAVNHGPKTAAPVSTNGRASACVSVNPLLRMASASQECKPSQVTSTRVLFENIAEKR
ncbi:hypothetical protein [Glutamicibacter mysorens]|nr:hypothetical protein [Glutamicibacter mysorens]